MIRCKGFKHKLLSLPAQESPQRRNTFDVIFDIRQVKIKRSSETTVGNMNDSNSNFNDESEIYDELTYRVFTAKAAKVTPS